MAKNDLVDIKTAERHEALFSKDQLLDSEKFSGYRDILSVLLKDGREYSVESAKQMIENYLKGRVK